MLQRMALATSDDSWSMTATTPTRSSRVKLMEACRTNPGPGDKKISKPKVKKDEMTTIRMKQIMPAKMEDGFRGSKNGQATGSK